MRIVLVNWARFADGALNGGGVNGYCRQLALELVRSGHEVAWLCGGLSYIAAADSGVFPPCEVRRKDDDCGVQQYEVMNSPVIAPAIFQFARPRDEVAAPELERELTRFLGLLRPDIVHFHNIEGFSCGCVDAAKSSSANWRGAGVLFSLHNYHTICPQVYLMRGGTTPCFDYENGHACIHCVDGGDVSGEKRVRAGLAREESPRIEVTAPTEQGVAGRLAGGLRSAIARRLTNPIPLPQVQPAFPGKNVSEARDVQVQRLESDEGTVRPNQAFAKWSQEELTSAAWSPLTNAHDARPSSSRVPCDYGLRRRAMVEMLSRCDRVLAVSAFVKQKFASMGVSAHALRTMPIGTRMTDIAAASPQLRLAHEARSACGEAGLRGLIRLAFMGYNNYFKGLPMLLDTLDLLAPEYLAKMHLFVWAKDLDRDRSRIESFRGRLGGLDAKGEYRYEEIPAMLCGMDAGLVPSVWWDNGPQTVMEFLACGVPVIGAALGGIPDLVSHGENGLLFRGNDRFALAQLLVDVIRSPRMITGLKSRIVPPLTMEAHAAEMIATYEQCLLERQ